MYLAALIFIGVNRQILEGAELTNGRRPLKRPSNQEPSSPGGGGDGTLMCHWPYSWGGGTVNPCLTHGDISRAPHIAEIFLKNEFEK